MEGADEVMVADKSGVQSCLRICAMLLIGLWREQKDEQLYFRTHSLEARNTGYSCVDKSDGARQWDRGHVKGGSFCPTA